MKASRMALLAACATIALVPAGALLYLWSHRHDAEVALQREVLLHSVAMAAHANQVLMSADQILDGLGRQLAGTGPLDAGLFRHRLAGQAGHRVLEQRLDHVGIVSDVFAFDAQGQCLASGAQYPAPAWSVADRPVFRFHARQPHERHTVVAVPSPVEAATLPAFLLSRPVIGSGGEFLGVLMVAVSTAYFGTYYDDLVRYSMPAAAEQSALALVRDDGVIVARNSGTGAPIGARVAQVGPYRELSKGTSQAWWTPQPRDYVDLSPWARRSEDDQVAIRHLAGYPLSVVASMNPAAFDAAWHRQCAEIAALSLLSFGLLTTAFVWLIRTLAARERQHDELSLLRDASESASRAKGEFLSTMSHEIRTPLNGIVGTAELLSMGKLDAEQRRFAETLLRSARGLLALIGEVLDFAKIESGTVDIDHQPFDVIALAHDVAALFTATASAKGLLLELEVPARIPHVMGDPMHLRQVLANLISNAVKFTDVGQVNLLLKVSPGDAFTRVRFCVRDSGIGIDPSIHGKLFEPFQQGDSSVGRRFGGTGLGLAISSHLVEAMGGRLEFESRVGEGATFHFELRFENASPEFVPAKANSLSVPARADLGSVSAADILVVEDDETNCLVIGAQLRLLGHRCAIASDGVEALAVRDLVKPDLVLMDCNLPRMSGYETTQRWRDLERAEGATPIPIIALSANITAENLAACREAGMDDFLPKPCTIERLNTALQRWLEPMGTSDAGTPS